MILPWGVAFSQIVSFLCITTVPLHTPPFPQPNPKPRPAASPSLLPPPGPSLSPGPVGLQPLRSVKKSSNISRLDAALQGHPVSTLACRQDHF